MSFKGAQIQPALGPDEVFRTEAALTADGNTGSGWNLPADRDRFHVFRAVVVMNIWIEAQASGVSTVQTRAFVRATQGGSIVELGMVELQPAAVDGGVTSMSETVIVVDTDAGLVMPDGHDLAISLDASSAGTPAGFRVVAWVTFTARTE